VRLRSARIGSQFQLAGASLSNPNDVALDAFRLSVGNDMFCTNGFTAEGQVDLSGTRIGGILSFAGAKLDNPNDVALNFREGRAASLDLSTQRCPQGIIDLTNAQVGGYQDEMATWPEVIRLRGFKYETLENGSISPRARMSWLARHPDGYAPGTHDNLATAYRRVGHVEAARRVMIDKYWRRRRELRFPGKAWNWLLYLTVGYGYRTWLAGLWLAVLLVIGTEIFAGAYPSYMHPTSASAPAFQPAVYTLDLLLPIVDLGQKKTWFPQGAALVWSWMLTGAGWALTTAVVAGMTNALRRE
jgi:hypothetical protein